MTLDPGFEPGFEPRFDPGPVRVRVPASSANLGPGFDAFGLALGCYDEVVARVRPGGLRVEVAGEGAATVRRSEDHLVVRAMRATFAALGGQPEGLEVRCTNRIPHSRGLGSSASAICAGVVAARALAARGADLDDDALLALATRLEGHPDNVAACLRGGLTLAWTEPRGPRALRLEPSPDVVPVACVPAARASTAEARGLLPAQVPHEAAAANAGRAALLVEALTRRPQLLLAATEDSLHQPYRLAAMPDTGALLAKLRDAGLPAVLSGAGPTVLVLCRPSCPDVVKELAGAGWRVWILRVATLGAVVVGEEENPAGGSMDSGVPGDA